MSSADTLTTDEMGIILAHLPLVSRSRLAGVSKSFRAAAEEMPPSTWAALSFEGRSPSESDIRRLTNRAGTQLHTLRLHTINLSDQALQTIASRELLHLHTLDLRGCSRITPLGVQAIVERAPALKSLFLAGTCHLGGGDDQALRERVLSLSEVDVSRCSGCSEVGACKTCMGCERALCTTADWRARAAMRAAKSCSVCDTPERHRGVGCADDFAFCHCCDRLVCPDCEGDIALLPACRECNHQICTECHHAEAQKAQSTKTIVLCAHCDEGLCVPCARDSASGAFQCSSCLDITCLTCQAEHATSECDRCSLRLCAGCQTEHPMLSLHPFFGIGEAQTVCHGCVDECDTEDRACGFDGGRVVGEGSSEGDDEDGEYDDE